MQGYIILFVFIFIIVLCGISFIFGWRCASKRAEKERLEDLARQEKDARNFENLKEDIKLETEASAKNEKEKLSSYEDAHDRFDAINAKLSDS
jgi:uncharacterized membrane protein